MIKVGILRGGISEEHDVSLKSGDSALSNLPKKYIGNDIMLSKSGVWYFNGWPSTPEKIFRSVDVIFNALHGKFGEDGKVQQIFDAFKIPYTGSGALSSAIGMNKILARESFARDDLLIPRAVVVEAGQDTIEAAKMVVRAIEPIWVVKPASSGSSFGISIVSNFNDLVKAIKKAADLEIEFSGGGKIIVEEYIKGREATCGVLENFRGEKHYSLPVIEIIPPSRFDFFDYGAKYSGETEEICPSNFDQKIKTTIEYMARKAHQSLGCRHYSRADFIISDRGIYLLEVNTLPGLTTESLLPKAIEVVGLSYPEFLDHLITSALSNK